MESCKKLMRRGEKLHMEAKEECTILREASGNEQRTEDSRLHALLRRCAELGKTAQLSVLLFVT